MAEMATRVPSPPADLIFHNGTVLTMEQDQPQAEAIAIQGERILAVGSNEEVLALQGATTQVIDLQGLTLMPGFVDAHSHLFNDAERLGFSLEEVQELALKNGITALGDMFVPPELRQRMQAFEREGKLRIRTSLYLIYNTNCGDVLGDWYRDLAPQREPGGMLHITGVKIFTDGGTCGAPALSMELTEGGGFGDLWLSQEELNQAVAEAQARGFQVAVHAIGDRAIEQTQNAIASALDGGPNTYRHRIEHNSVLRPDLLSRYSEIGIVATIFGEYPACNPFAPLPSGYRDWEWRWRDLIDVNPGLHIAWSSDWPFFSLSPIANLYSFVTRNHMTEDGRVCEALEWHKDDTISMEEALPMMTIESAYALFRDAEVGSLKPGKFADLIVLSANPLAVDPNGIKDIQVLLTVVGGRIEYCRLGYEGLCPAGILPEANILPIGFHDGSEGEQDRPGCLAFGWAADPNDRDIDLRTRIMVDGVEVAQIVASDFRQDLKDVGECPEGTCGFTVDLWGLITQDADHSVLVQAQDGQTGEWVDLSLTPKTLNCKG